MLAWQVFMNQQPGSERQINRPGLAHYSARQAMVTSCNAEVAEKRQPNMKINLNDKAVRPGNSSFRFRLSSCSCFIVFNFNHLLFKLQAINWARIVRRLRRRRRIRQRVGSIIARLVNWKCAQRSRAVARQRQPTLVRCQLVAGLLSRNDNSPANGGAGFIARRSRRRRATAAKCFLKEMYNNIGNYCS